MNTKKYLDAEGLMHLWSKIAIDDHPTFETLSTVIDSIEEELSSKLHFVFVKELPVTDIDKSALYVHYTTENSANELDVSTLDELILSGYDYKIYFYANGNFVPLIQGNGDQAQPISVYEDADGTIVISGSIGNGGGDAGMSLLASTTTVGDETHSITFNLPIPVKHFFVALRQQTGNYIFTNGSGSISSATTININGSQTWLFNGGGNATSLAPTKGGRFGGGFAECYVLGGFLSVSAHQLSTMGNGYSSQILRTAAMIDVDEVTSFEIYPSASNVTFTDGVLIQIWGC